MDGLSRESQFGTDFCTYIVLFVEINASWRQLEIAQENSRSYHQTIWIATNFLPKVKPWSVTTAFLGEWRFLGCKFSEQKGMKQDGVRKTMGPLAPKPIFFFAFGALIYDNFHQGRTTMHHHKDLRLAPSETKRLFPLQALRGGLVWWWQSLWLGDNVYVIHKWLRW